jgi:hypothetical protein
MPLATRHRFGLQMAVDRDRDESEGAALTCCFVWVAFFVVVVAYYIAKFAAHDFAGFGGPEDIDLGALIIGLATMVLVGFQILLANGQVSISLRQDRACRGANADREGRRRRSAGAGSTARPCRDL